MSPDQVDAPPLRHRALLIANWTFEKLDHLNGPPHDIAALEAALCDADVGVFEKENVVVVDNRDDRVVKQAIYDFVGPAQKNDVLLIYYSGHGVRVPGGSEMILATAKTDAQHPIVAGVPTSLIAALLSDSASEQAIVILDCCYAAGGFKGGTSGTELETNAYVLASSGTHEQTKDAKNHGEPSPFTKLLVECIRDKEILPNDENYVLIDSMWPKLRDLRPKPQRLTKVDGSMPLARRGDIRTGRTSGFGMLSLFTTPDVVDIDVTMTRDKVTVVLPDSPDVPDERALAFAESLRYTIRRLLELLDGAGRLEDPPNGLWTEVCRKAWDGLGGTLLSAAIPPRLKEYLLSIDPAETAKLHKLRLRIEDSDLEAYPWEALSAGTEKEREYRHLGLNDGVLIERVLNQTKSTQSSNKTSSILFGVFAPFTSDRYRYVDQILNRLDAQREGYLQQHDHLKGKEWSFNLLDKACTWVGLVRGDLRPTCLVLAFPLRRHSGSPLQVGFSGSDSEPDWIEATTFGDELARSGRYDCIVVENIASEAGFNSYRATIEFSHMLAEKGLSPVVYICHPASFKGYPTSSHGNAPTFSSELILALESGVGIDLAVWHARRSVLRFFPKLRTCFGFPGYYNTDTSARHRSQTAKPAPSASEKLHIQPAGVGRPAEDKLQSAVPSGETESDIGIDNEGHIDGAPLDHSDDAETKS